MLMEQTKLYLIAAFKSSTLTGTLTLISGDARPNTTITVLKDSTTSALSSAESLFRLTGGSYGYYGLAPGANTAVLDANNPVVPEDDRDWCGLTLAYGITKTFKATNGLTCIHTFLNEKDVDVTVNCTYFIYRDPQLSLPVLLAHEKFDEPVVLAPGETVTFQYVIGAV